MKHSQILLVTLLIGGSVVALGGCGGGSGSGVAPNPPVTPNSPVAATQTLILRTKLAMSDADVAKLPSDFVEKAATAGWHRIAGGFEKSGPGPNIKVTDGKTTVTTDTQGKFAIPGNPAAVRVVADEKKNVSVAAARLSSSQAISSTTKKGQAEADSPQEWVLDVPSEMNSPMSCCADQKELCAKPEATPAKTNSRSTKAEPMDGRCLDYNGWWSDGGNYGKTDWRAYRNFVRSDCDRAFFSGCWRDHYSGGCWAVHGSGGCSRVIGHSADYHKHNFPS